MTFKQEQLSLLVRIIRTQDGRDLLNNVLLPLTNENYQDILASNESNRSELVGKGLQLKELISIFETAEEKLRSFTIVESEDRF
jgi:hypothetical protein